MLTNDDMGEEGVNMNDDVIIVGQIVVNQKCRL